MPLTPLQIVTYVGLVGVLIALFVATAQNKWQPRVFALLALRLAIGWHFCFEGLHKIHSTWVGDTDTNRPFTSANYFNVGDGPGAEMARKQFIRDPEADYTERLLKKKELTTAEFAALPADQQAELCPDAVGLVLKKLAEETLPRATEEQQKAEETLKVAEAKAAAELTDKQTPPAAVFGGGGGESPRHDSGGGGAEQGSGHHLPRVPLGRRRAGAAGRVRRLGVRGHHPRCQAEGHHRRHPGHPGRVAALHRRGWNTTTPSVPTAPSSIWASATGWR